MCEIKSIIPPFFVLFVVTALPLHAVDKGTESFASGDYAQAVATFAEAEKESPGDLRITYNLGVAQAASGDFTGAVATLRKSALAKDADIASKSLILIGDIAVVQSRLLLVPPPGETPPQDRSTIFELLAVAERTYLEAVELKPSEQESLRRNIEQIRAWKSRTESDWNLADREKKRKELELPQRFDWLEQWERKIRTNLKRTVSEADSPKKFQAFYEASKEQQRLLEEIPPLKDSLRQALPEEAATLFASAVGTLGETATVANNALREMQGQTALDAATTTVERLAYLKDSLYPFEAIVQEATTKQESLCKVNSDGDADFDEQAWMQNSVAVKMPLMLVKAQQKSEEDSENLRQAKELAIQHASEIESSAAAAAEFLREKSPEAALPQQERALELLREIMKHLQQNQDQQQNQEQDGEQQQDQDKKQDQDQNRNEQGSKDQQNQNAGQDQNEKKEENQPSTKEKLPAGKEQMPQEKQEELEKAQRMLRQVKRWQQSADERREKVRALLMQMDPIDKDW